MTLFFEALYRYQSWANAELFGVLETVDRDLHPEAADTALGLASHSHVVARIFAAHLRGIAHDYVSDNLDETPPLDELRQSVAASDRWYLDYVRSASPETLEETVSFVFTDGDRGAMSRGEMLTHVAMHGTYHRGEIGRIFWSIGITPPWDTFAVHLHRAQPERRSLQRPVVPV